MKKKLLLVLACLTLAAMALTGCGKPDLAGTTWSISRVEFSTGDVSEGDEALAIGAWRTLTFADETNVEYSEWQLYSSQGTYEVQGDKLLITLGDKTTEFGFDGNQITLDADDGSLRYVFTQEK